MKQIARPLPDRRQLDMTGMVVCGESYVGAVGERDGVKLEQQILLVDGGYELLSTYPLENCLLD